MYGLSDELIESQRRVRRLEKALRHIQQVSQKKIGGLKFLEFKSKDSSTEQLRDEALKNLQNDVDWIQEILDDD